MADVTVYSPYEKVYDYYSQDGNDIILCKIRDYLLCMPSKECPSPILTNENPRVRLVKYLYYDTPNPLNERMPTVEQRKSIVFDPFNPVVPHGKRYRVFTQMDVNQAELESATTLRILTGKEIPYTPFSATTAIRFLIFTNYTLESNLRTSVLSRTFAIEKCIIAALNGVNMQGVGSFTYARNAHPDCGSTYIYDEKMNIGRSLVIAFESMGGSPEGQEASC